MIAVNHCNKVVERLYSLNYFKLSFFQLVTVVLQVPSVYCAFHSNTYAVLNNQLPIKLINESLLFRMRSYYVNIVNKTRAQEKVSTWLGE